MTIPVVFHRMAENDLDSILRFVAADSLANAAAFVDRIEQHCLSLGDFPWRGRALSDCSREMRELVFERRVVIVYGVAADRVTILRIRYGGRDAVPIPSAAD